MKKHWLLFWEFFKIGLFTFGGGLAMIPLIERIVVSKRGWMTDEEMVDMVAIAESTPGVIAVNSATFVGYRVGKILGAIMATLGVILPSFIIIITISIFYDRFMEFEVVKWAFMGIKACVAILILNAGYRLFRKCHKDIFVYLLMLVSFLLCLFVDISTIFIIMGGLILGIIIYTIMAKRTAKKEVEE